MRKIAIRNPVIQDNIKAHQIFWLEFWEELLNKQTIEPYSAPLTNLYWMLSELHDIDIFKTKISPMNLKRRLIEMKYSDLGIDYDMIAREIAVQLPSFRKSITELEEGTSTDTEYSMIKAKNTFILLNKTLNEDKFPDFLNVYWAKLVFRLYERISRKQVIFNEADKLGQNYESRAILDEIEILTKIFIAELLNRNFSWDYLETRPAIFTQKNNYHKGDFQLKLNSLFSELLRSNETWNVVFKLAVPKDIIKIKNFQELTLTDTPKIFFEKTIKRLINKNIEYSAQLHFYQNEDKLTILNEFISKIKDNDNNDNEELKNLLTDLYDFDLTKVDYTTEEIKSFWIKLHPLIKRFQKSITKKGDLVLSSIKELYEFSEVTSKRSTLGDINLEISMLPIDRLIDYLQEEAKKNNYSDLLRVMFYLLGDGNRISDNVKRNDEKLMFLEDSKKIFAIVRGIFAPDPRAAETIAMNRLLRLFNVIRYNCPEIRFGIDNIDRKCLLISDYKILLQSRKKRNASMRSKKIVFGDIIPHLQKIKGYSNNNLQVELQNIMNWYGIYLDAEYDAEKFLSLWIGLEKLFTNQKTNNIGETITKSISPIISLYFVRKILRNLWLDFDRFELCKQLSSGFEIKTSGNRVDEADLFFAIKYKGDDMLQMVSSENNSIVLLRRIKEIQMALSNASNLRKWVNSYDFHVQSNLWKLYSIRNKIAHEAFIDADLSRYIKQLDYFFRIAYENILYSSSADNFEKIIDEYYNRYKVIWDKGQSSLVDKFYSDLIVFDHEKKQNKRSKLLNASKGDLKSIIIDPTF